jgi:hypothetical protein
VLLHGMEVDLIARPSVSILKVPRRTGILRGGFLHAPPCGPTSSRPGFPDRGYPRKSLETT